MAATLVAAIFINPLARFSLVFSLPAIVRAYA
jgi:hypothetical protein